MSPRQLSAAELPGRDAVLASGDVLNLNNWPAAFPFRDEFVAGDGARFTRQDVFDAFDVSVEKGVIATILWGYQKGRLGGYGTQGIEAVFNDPKPLVDAVHRIRCTQELSSDEILRELNGAVLGISTSTTTKLAYFAGVTSADGPCLIYDIIVIRSLMNGPYAAFMGLGGVLPGNSRSDPMDAAKVRQHQTYGAYLARMSDVARSLGAGIHPDQLELFLFSKPNRGHLTDLERERNKKKRAKRLAAQRSKAA